MEMETMRRLGVISGFVAVMASSIAGAEINTATDLGMIKLDGSSTVYPIMEAVVEEFQATSPKTKLTVGVSGTGGGFKKFCAGETDFSNASRPIKATESELCKKNGIEYIELPVAYDALTVVVNPKNTWLNSITVAELKKIWEPEAQGKITRWNQVNPAWPDQPIALFGAGVDSGTYDYFTEAIVGKEDMSRGDYTSSEDDNVLVQGVSGNVNALGFFGIAYYNANKDKVKALTIDDGKEENGKGPQAATVDNVLKGVYQPLARPLFIYVSKKSAMRPEVTAFVNFMTANSVALTNEVGYVPLTPSAVELAAARFEKRQVGSLFAHGGSQVGVTLEELLKKSS
jgi:phosphate transport system substrate-binding protein